MTGPQQPPATLAIHRGAARTTISASPHLHRLAELRFIGRQPAVAVTSVPSAAASGSGRPGSATTNPTTTSPSAAGRAGSR